MIRIIRAAERYTADRGWLQTAWLFSFDEYYDPENVQFSALRVFNDDVVQPGHGFPLHPHREAEIITIPLRGELTHEDTLGNRGVIGPGDVQQMTAGSGVRHSERNEGDVPVHLYQIWLLPHTAGLPPSYDQRHYDAQRWHNQLAPVASGRGIPDVVAFHTDATIYRAAFDAGHTLNYPIEDDRCVFLYLTTGALDLNGERLAEHDQARIRGEQHLHIRVEEDTHFVLIDLPPRTR
jgi:redox-sensitive bicupin YhaK (pirin superfamily)